MRCTARVSIHAPRAGRDHIDRAKVGRRHSFNPRAPCGARQPLHISVEDSPMFQSTRPVRGATVCKALCSPCHIVSIHAPRAGRDEVRAMYTQKEMQFQSTRPVRGATIGSGTRGRVAYVSIHAPRAGRDEKWTKTGESERSFNPRAPCGARPTASSSRQRGSLFQSTRPVRGATAKEVTTSLFCHIFMGITRHKYDFLDV